MTDILSLTGKDLDRELDKIIKDTPKGVRGEGFIWTPKDDYILTKLHKAEVDRATIAKKLGRTLWAVKSRLQYIQAKA